MVLFANAKINIGLNILSKRNDGYHEINSIMYPIGLFDAVEAIPAEDGKFEFSTVGLTIPGNPQQNLCVKAWELLHANYQIPPVKISLLKNIPIGSGLGGGSSDSAFMLKLLNQLFNLSVSNDGLREFAAQLGSDCPFFIENKPCLVSGRGEIFEKTPLTLKDYWVAVVKPEIHVSTQKAYSMVIPRMPTFNLKELHLLPLELWKEHLINDFEEPISKLHPAISDIKNQLYKQGAIYATMTGSGSAVYGIFQEEPPKLNFGKNNFFIWLGKIL